MTPKQSSSFYAPAARQVDQNRIFVYKIIHDLRHPTQALADGLGTLVDSLKSTEEVIVSFSIKKMRYICSNRVKKALKNLRAISPSKDPPRNERKEPKKISLFSKDRKEE